MGNISNWCLIICQCSVGVITANKPATSYLPTPLMWGMEYFFIISSPKMFVFLYSPISFHYHVIPHPTFNPAFIGSSCHDVNGNRTRQDIFPGLSHYSRLSGGDGFCPQGTKSQKWTTWKVPKCGLLIRKLSKRTSTLIRQT